MAQLQETGLCNCPTANGTLSIPMGMTGGGVQLGLEVDGLVQLGLESGVVPGLALPGYMVGQLAPETGVALPGYMVGQLAPEIGVALPSYMVGQLAPEIGVALPGYMVGQLEHNFFLVPGPFYAGKSL